MLEFINEYFEKLTSQLKEVAENGSKYPFRQYSFEFHENSNEYFKNLIYYQYSISFCMKMQVNSYSLNNADKYNCIYFMRIYRSGK